MEDCQIMKSVIEEFGSVPKDTKDSNLKVNIVTFTGISSEDDSTYIVRLTKFALKITATSGSHGSYVDSACTIYITHCKDDLINYTLFANENHVILGDGSKIRSYGSSIKVFHTKQNGVFTLHNVWYIPDMEINLISQNQL